MEPNDVITADKAIETPAPSLATMSAADRQKFMATGDVDIDALLAEPKETSEPAAADKAPVVESGAASDAAGKDLQEPPKETRFEKRYKKMEARALAAESRLAELDKGSVADKQPEVISSAKRPRAKDYPTIDAWEDACEAFDLKERKSAIAEALRTEREAESRKAQETERERTESDVVNSLAKQITDFKKATAIKDFDEKFLEMTEFLKESKAGHLEFAIAESDKGAALINYFGDHPEELEKLAAMSQTAGLRALGHLEASGKIKVPATKKITDAKRIIPEVDGKGAASDEQDELESAAARGDMKTFNRIMDLREKRAMAESRR